MLKLFPYLMIATWFLTGCEPSLQQSRTVRENTLLHDNSSKVWMVNDYAINGEFDREQDVDKKKVIVFYNDQSYFECPINQLGHVNVHYGNYEVENDIITFSLEGSSTQFTILKMNKDAVELQSIGEENQVFLKLIPLPKL